MGKTITTYLIDSNPQSAQYVFISNKICKMLVIPRASLSIINSREELQGPAFYILLGEDDVLQPKAYLGETENFRERIKEHDSKKTFWQKALIFISKDGDMTKSDVKYLEYVAIQLSIKSKRFVLDENKRIPSLPRLPEHQKDSMDEFFEDIKLLTSFIGCEIFDIIEQKGETLFYIDNKDCKATGFYNETGFVVLKNSELSPKTQKSFGWKETRDKFIETFTNKLNGKIMLMEDQTFKSPSAAANMCLGSSNNGWIVWKDKSGQTLDEAYRKRLE